MKTSELIGPALDWAVAKCEGELAQNYFYLHESTGAFMLEVGEVSWVYSPSIKWAQGGPIIERKRISLASPSPIHKHWTAMTWCNAQKQDGPTSLIAAMRCYVASKLGNDIDVPEELK